MIKRKTGIVLMNMGGPGAIEDVEPFLYNLFMDPDIIDIPLGKIFRPFIAKKISKKRAITAQGYYEKIGGKSPLLELTLNQASALNETLSKEEDVTTTVAMRYWHPYTDEAIREILSQNVDTLVLLPLYPQYSRATSGSSLNEFYRHWARMGKDNMEVIEIKDWHDNPGYIQSWVEKIRNELDSFGGKVPHLIFSAHGIPQKMVDEGDPYQQQTEETVKLILEKLNWNGPWHLSYQSRVGPVKWLKPSTEDIIKSLGEKSTDGALMIPISFVSDHSETLYEMDILYRDMAAKAGIKKFKRVPSLNSSPTFIKALKDMVLNKISVEE